MYFKPLCQILHFGAQILYFKVLILHFKGLILHFKAQDIASLNLCISSTYTKI